MAQRVRFCGVDVGSSALHVACVVDPAARGELAGLVGAVGSSPGPWVDRCPDAAALGGALAALAQRLGLGGSGTPAAVALPSSALIIKPVDLPPFTAAECRAALYLEMDRIAPQAADEMVGDWLSLAGPNGSGAGQMHLLLAARQRAVWAVSRALKAARLRAAAVEPEPAALFRLARMLAQPGSEAAEVLVDLGASSTRLVVVRGGQLLLFRELTVGGEQLARALAARLQVEPAEAMERSRLQADFGPEALGAAGERLLSEVERSLRYVEHRYRQEGYGALRLVGGGAHWPCLRRLMEAAVGRRAEEQIVLEQRPVDPALAQAAALALWRRGGGAQP